MTYYSRMTELNPVALRVLLVVAEHGSFTSAAASLGYSQSAVSRQVAALERATGRLLFERHRDGVRLTAAGGRLLPRARLIVDELDAQHPLRLVLGDLPGAQHLGDEVRGAVRQGEEASRGPVARSGE